MFCCEHWIIYFTAIKLIFKLQGKLIKLYARQLMTKAKLQDDILPSERKHVPSLEQWLQVVGLSAESIQVCVYIFEM
jgi:hypothetical protein